MYTFFDTLHHAPSGAICRRQTPAHTRYLGIASKFVLYLLPVTGSTYLLLFVNIKRHGRHYAFNKLKSL